MNETPHIDLTRQETARIIEVTEYIATHLSDSCGRIKRKFGLTNAEYETMMELAMPLIRVHGRVRNWKGVYTYLLRRLARLIDTKEDPETRLARLEGEIRQVLKATIYNSKPLDHLLDDLVHEIGEEDE